MEPNTRTLDCIGEEETVRVASLEMQGTIRSRLMDLGVIPGALVTCVHAGGGIAAYRICGAVIALRSTDAQHILITNTPPVH